MSNAKTELNAIHLQLSIAKDKILLRHRYFSGKLIKWKQSIYQLAQYVHDQGIGTADTFCNTLRC